MNPVKRERATANDYSEAAEALKEEAKREKRAEAQRQYRKRKKQKNIKRDAAMVKLKIENQELNKALRKMDESSSSSSINTKNGGSR